jgi:Asp-tRNA(Asn)/Glu-tRNA(Gln) amidotransferase A subunit family amidase
VVRAHVDALVELEPLRALITGCPDGAAARARRGIHGPLAGVPLLVKDLFDTAGVRTTYGSRIYAEHVPPRTAAAVSLLEQAGAIVIGKANLHEFAWGTTSQNPHWGFVGNPARPGRVAGGSSGGNAAALAARVSALGLGTDTAGSVRIPSACCGTVGFKPSPGRVPIEGCLPLAPSFDVVGPMARTVADCALASAVLTGDPAPEPSIQGLVVGVLDRPPRMSPHEPGGIGDGAPAALGDETERLEALGARVVSASLPEPEADVIPILLHEAALAHRETFPARRDEYGPDTKLKWDAALRVPPTDVAAAYSALPRWRERARAESAVDVYLTPTLAIDVPPIDVWEPDVRVGMVANTRTFSFLGWAAIAIGSFQLAGPDDHVVLAAALAWEEAYGPPAGAAIRATARSSRNDDGMSGS